MLSVTVLRPAVNRFIRGWRQYIMFQLILYVVWLAFAGRITAVTMLVGVPVTALPAVLFRHTYRIIGSTALFARAPHLIHFAFRTVVAMITASFTVAMYAFRPKLELRSTILSYEPKIADRLGLTVLALAITVTPGTIVVDRDNVHMYVHVIALADRSDNEIRASIAALEAPLAQALRETGR